MTTATDKSVFPLRQCKTIHLVRHAQGIHNVEGQKDQKAYLSSKFFDAELTELGWKQVDDLRKHVIDIGVSKRVQLVVTSPLLRTMQTAAGVFGHCGISDSVNVSSTTLMVANTGNSSRPSISRLNCPPFIAVELCRERLGVHPCDKRKSIKEYKPTFPGIDFSMIQNEDDILWSPENREDDEQVKARGIEFLDWLWKRKEMEIAVVTHSGFLLNLVCALGNDSNPSVKKEICKSFDNCELRSLVLINNNM